MTLTSPAFDPNRNARGPLGTLALNVLIVAAMVLAAESFLERRGILYGRWYWPYFGSVLAVLGVGVAAVFKQKRWGIPLIGIALATYAGVTFAMGELPWWHAVIVVAVFAGVLFDTT